MSRDFRMFMTGAVAAVFIGGLLQLVTLPWWLHMLSWVVGGWALFDLGRAWKREFDRQRAEKERW